MKTYSAKPKEVNRQWYVIDASEDSLGRVSTATAKLLLGKNKPMFTHHIDCGDYVVIINASSLKVTGNKLEQKRYYRHSGYPGGLHSRSLKEQLDRDPAVAINHAVKGMLPNNKLLAQRLNRLKVYPGEDHQHAAQKPIPFSIKKGETS